MGAVNALHSDADPVRPNGHQRAERTSCVQSKLKAGGQLYSHASAHLFSPSRRRLQASAMFTPCCSNPYAIAISLALSDLGAKHAGLLRGWTVRYPMACCMRVIKHAPGVRWGPRQKPDNHRPDVPMTNKCRGALQRLRMPHRGIETHSAQVLGCSFIALQPTSRYTDLQNIAEATSRARCRQVRRSSRYNIAA